MFFCGFLYSEIIYAGCIDFENVLCYINSVALIPLEAVYFTKCFGGLNENRQDEYR